MCELGICFISINMVKCINVIYFSTYMWMGCNAALLYILILKMYNWLFLATASSYHFLFTKITN